MKDCLAGLGCLVLFIAFVFLIVAGVDYVVENGDYPSNVTKRSTSRTQSMLDLKAYNLQQSFVYKDKVQVIVGHYTGQVGTIYHRLKAKDGQHTVLLKDSEIIVIDVQNLMKVEKQ